MTDHMDKYWASMEEERDDKMLYCPECMKYQKFKGGYAHDSYYGVDGSWWECTSCGFSDSTL